LSIAKQEFRIAGGFKELVFKKFPEQLAFYTNETQFTVNGNVKLQNKGNVTLKIPSQFISFFA